ncbi:hypothetical protein BC829DRAFT_384442 [Chytridium lagenaria]|nr:hypothetical protein BC829DRAFT_384442 [Chytridium lagenaria]
MLARSAMGIMMAISSIIIFIIFLSMNNISNTLGMYDVGDEEKLQPSGQFQRILINNPSEEPSSLSPFFNRTDSSLFATERWWWQSRLNHYQTVFITSANTASVPMVKNMICSLLNVAPDLLDHVVIWALDEGLVAEILNWRKEILDGSFFDWTGRNEQSLRETMKAWKSPLGVYFEPDSTAEPVFASGTIDQHKYLSMMNLRKSFFTRLLDSIGINMLFSDADTFYLSNPFEDLNLPYGVPNPENRYKVASNFGWFKSEPENKFLSDYPDIVYSTDARKPYHLLQDPYEGQPHIPKICGGFFFCSALLESGGNDQWGLDDILNYHIPSVMIDPLPAGIKLRKPLNQTNVDSNFDPIRVRILSQLAYANAMPQWAPPGQRGEGWEKYTNELKERGEKEVMFHPNYWKDADKPDNRIWVFTDNKTWIFEELGMWKIKNGKCVL